MDLTKQTDKITQNLKDAGCTPAEISDFLEKWKSGKQKQALQLLSEHRKRLLNQFHKSKDCIDCLDYLVFQMEKEQKKSEVQQI